MFSIWQNGTMLSIDRMSDVSAMLSMCNGNFVRVDNADKECWFVENVLEKFIFLFCGNWERKFSWISFFEMYFFSMSPSSALNIYWFSNWHGHVQTIMNVAAKCANKSIWQMFIVFTFIDIHSTNNFGSIHLNAVLIFLIFTLIFRKNGIVKNDFMEAWSI